MLAAKDDRASRPREAIGCPIARTAAKTTPDNGAVTYYRDVQPILQNHCQGCHRPGEVGPFSLMTYKQAVNWADDIKSYTKDKKMPPWKPVAGAAFHNERRLSDKEIATLAAWADNGTPAGNPPTLPPAEAIRRWLATRHARSRPGDRRKTSTSAPAAAIMFRCYVLPTNETEDKYVTAIEVRPGNRRVVHHALNFVDTAGSRPKAGGHGEGTHQEGQTRRTAAPAIPSAMGVGFRPAGGMGGWAPGQMSRHLPEGTGYHLPKGADVVVADPLPSRRPGCETDRTRIGLYFAKKPVAQRFQSVVIPGRFLVDPGRRTTTSRPRHRRGAAGLQIHSVMPHMQCSASKSRSP